MGTSEDDVAPEVPDAGDTEAAPLGVLWTWTPDSAPPAPERPFAEQVAEVVQQVESTATVTAEPGGAPVGKLWTWEPSAADLATPAAPLPQPPAPPPLAQAPAPAAVINAPLWGPTPPLAAAAPPAPPVVPPPAPVAEPESAPVINAPLFSATPLADAPPAPPVLQPLAPAAEPAPAPTANTSLYGATQTPWIDNEVTTLRPVFNLDPDLVLPPPAPLAAPVLFDALDDEYWSSVRAAVRRKRRIRIGLAALLVAVCAALPFAVPQIPDLFAGAVPEQKAKTVTDPAIDAPTPQPGVSFTPVPGLAGKRLASAGTPLEVVVPRLHVKSPVVPISGATGELVPPDNPQLLGWWQEGSGVGSANGSAVVTGHTVSAGGGAFDHLGELVRGDRIRVRTSAGLIDYVVTASRDVPVKQLARDSAKIFRQSGSGRLVLITCSDFNGEIYLSNSVVYATPIKDRPRASG